MAKTPRTGQDPPAALTTDPADGRTASTRAEGKPLGDKDGICDESFGRRGREMGDPPNPSWNNSGAPEKGRLREQREFSSRSIPGCSMALTVKAFIPLQLA